MNDVQVLNLLGFDLRRFSSYNPHAFEQVDRLVEGYAHERKLADLVADPSLPATSLEPD